MIVASCEDWSDQTRWFIASVVSFLDVELPDELMAKLYDWDNEEDEDETTEDAA
jgi:hypothetical protein